MVSEMFYPCYRTQWPHQCQLVLMYKAGGVQPGINKLRQALSFLLWICIYGVLFFRKQNVDHTCHTNSSVAGKIPREHSLTVQEDSKEITSYHSGHSKSKLSCYPVTSWAVTIAQWPFLALHLTWTVSQPHYISYGKKGTRLLESSLSQV